MDFSIVFLAISILIGITSFYLINNFRKKKKPQDLISRFRKKFKYQNRMSERRLMAFSNKLMSDPERNINIKSWENEYDLREKADIHRARLSRYGKSKMNGEMIFMGPKGGVYTYSSGGRKKYI